MPKVDRPLRSLPLVELAMTPGLRQIQAMGGIGHDARVFTLGECNVILAREHGLWHVSISHRDRLPRWAEVIEARYRLMPDRITVAMLLPPKDEYVNIHSHCFHLWEIEDPGQREIIVP